MDLFSEPPRSRAALPKGTGIATEAESRLRHSGPSDPHRTGGGGWASSDAVPLWSFPGQQRKTKVCVGNRQSCTHSESKTRQALDQTEEVPSYF